MLLKGLGETRDASSPLQAAEMVLIRLIYASELPTPGDLVKRLAERPSSEGARPGGPAAPPPGGAPAPVAERAPQAAAAPRLQPSVESAPAAAPETPARPTSFAEVVALAEARREVLLASHLSGDVHLVHFEPGRIEFRPDATAPRDLAGRLGRLLQEWTGERWVVSVSDAPGEATLRDARREALEREHAAAREDPLVQAVLETFPGAKVVALRDETPRAERDPEAGGQADG
jgi:DNA polymerase-3 subunit gamma/tau